ncbi:MAG: hypothetical protein ACTTKY_07425 [Catonella sp.]
MFMHVNVKKLVYAGLCLAISMVLILLEGVFGMSTLFLLSLSGFFAGIVIRESGFKMGAAYIVASLALAFFIAPDKIKIVTYMVVEIYIFAREGIWELLAKRTIKDVKKTNLIYVLSKLIVFNILTVPMVLIFPELLLPDVDIKWMLIAIALLQPAWFIGDKAYDAFQIGIWNRIRSLI